jgi:hypothetical protein
MEAPESTVKMVKDFAKGSYRLVKRCTKPDRKGEGFEVDLYRLLRFPRSWGAWLASSSGSRELCDLLATFLGRSTSHRCC